MDGNQCVCAYEGCPLRGLCPVLDSCHGCLVSTLPSTAKWLTVPIDICPKNRGEWLIHRQKKVVGTRALSAVACCIASVATLWTPCNLASTIWFVFHIN
eukprot:6465635-Amphidinium_carterae.1